MYVYIYKNKSKGMSLEDIFIRCRPKENTLTVCVNWARG